MACIRTERRGRRYPMHWFMQSLTILAVLGVGFAVPPGGVTFAGEKKTIAVVTTTEDLAAIAREVGGERAHVATLTHGYQDPHFIDAKPSYLVQLKKADLFIRIGRELEVGWAPGLVTSSRNARIQPGAAGSVDASSQVAVIEVPSSVSRSQGDIHPFGNPHYWLDLANVIPLPRTSPLFPYTSLSVRLGESGR